MSDLRPRLDRESRRVVMTLTMRDAEELMFILEQHEGWDDDVRALRDIVFPPSADSNPSGER